MSWPQAAQQSDIPRQRRESQNAFLWVGGCDIQENECFKCWLSCQKKRAGTSMRPDSKWKALQSHPTGPREAKRQRERAQQVEPSPAPNNYSICFIHQASTKASSTAKNKAETSWEVIQRQRESGKVCCREGSGRNL